MESKKANQSKILMTLSMAVFGSIGIFRRYIDLPSDVIALARAVIGTAFLLFVVLIKKDKLDFNAIRKNGKYLVLSGIFIAFNWILLFEAYCYTTVATATLCYYMAPIFLVLAAPLFLKENLSFIKIVSLIIAFTGMVLVSGIIKTGFGNTSELKGVFLGLGAAVLYASVMILNKKIRDINAYYKTIVQLSVSAISLLPYTFIMQKGSDLSVNKTEVLMLLIVGIIHTGASYAMYFGSMSNLKAHTIAMYSYIDPILAIVLSALILKEKIGFAEIIGAVLILGGTLISDTELIEMLKIKLIKHK